MACYGGERHLDAGRRDARRPLRPPRHARQQHLRLCRHPLRDPAVRRDGGGEPAALRVRPRQRRRVPAGHHHRQRPGAGDAAHACVPLHHMGRQPRLRHRPGPRRPPRRGKLRAPLLRAGNRPGHRRRDRRRPRAGDAPRADPRSRGRRGERAAAGPAGPGVPGAARRDVPVRRGLPAVHDDPAGRAGPPGPVQQGLRPPARAQRAAPVRAAGPVGPGGDQAAAGDGHRRLHAAGRARPGGAVVGGGAARAHRHARLPGVRRGLDARRARPAPVGPADRGRTRAGLAARPLPGRVRPGLGGRDHRRAGRGRRQSSTASARGHCGSPGPPPARWSHAPSPPPAGRGNAASSTSPASTTVTTK